jgi:hypothetical protein
MLDDTAKSVNGGGWLPAAFEAQLRNRVADS